MKAKARFNIDKFTILEPRLDWISIVGDIPEIYYEEETQREVIKNKFHDWGFDEITKRHSLTFRNDFWGVEISFYKRRNTGDKQLKIEVQGKGCCNSTNATEEKIRSITQKVWSFLGVPTPPRATRLDFAVDILEAKLTDIFPDIASKKYKLITNSKKKSDLTLSKYYKNPEDLSEETGFTLNNSRLDICVYDRIFALNDKYKLQQNGIHYVKYYEELYGASPRVLRIETRVKKRLCDYFNIAFFAGKMPLKEALPQSLAHFNSHHRFFNTETNQPLEHLDRLYFRSEFKTIKTLQSNLNPNLKLKEIFFKHSEHNLEVRIIQLARAIIKNEKTSPGDFRLIMEGLKQAINKESFNLKVEMEQFLKSCAFFSLDPTEQNKLKLEFFKLVEELKKNQNKPIISTDEVDDFLTFIHMEPSYEKNT